MIHKTYDKYSRETSNIVIDRDYIAGFIETMLIQPSSLPMVCAPLPWSDTSYGGYLTNVIDKIDITTGSVDHHNHKIDNKQCLFDAINQLNSIRFRINKDLLNFITNEGSYLLDSEDNQQEIILTIAKFYKDTYFYLNTHSDWRGRIYTHSFCLQSLIKVLISHLVCYYLIRVSL